MSGDVYPLIEQWLVPEDVWPATLGGVVEAGKRGHESGAFWLGTRSRFAEIEVVILPSGPGVEEHAYQWRVSPEVFGEVSRWAKPRGLSLLGIAHTHKPGVPAELSLADRVRSVQAPGVLAVVIGNGGTDNEFTRWGWYVYEKSDYRRMARSELQSRIQVQRDAHVMVCKADTSGVWPLD